MPTGGSLTTYLVTLGVVAVILVIRKSRPRRLKIDRLWVWPAIYLLLLAVTLAETDLELTPLNIALMVGAFVIGGLMGWRRARFVEVHIHPETQDLTSRASPIGVLFIFAILVLRLALRDYLAANAATLHLPVIALGTAFLVLAIAMLIGQRLELWRRATRMLADAKAARAGGVPPPPESLVG